jgi:hypothetical protein
VIPALRRRGRILTSIRKPAGADAGRNRRIVVLMKTHFWTMCLFLACIGVILTAAVGCSGCIRSEPETTAPVVQAENSTVERIEILHFHPTRQCSSCIAIGAFAEETVTTYFSPELESGKIVFAHINVENPENRDIVERYEPTHSSLFIGVYDNEGFHKEEDLLVWYKLDNETDFKNHLKSLIEQRLEGDFS